MPTVAVTKDFKLVFLGCLFLTVVALVIAVIFSYSIANPSETQKEVIKSCQDIAKFGSGAIFGLIGGKLSK